MNPSRIMTPLEKKFDEWWFRYKNLPLKYDVYIRRTRDVEAEYSKGKFHCEFYAVPNRKSLEKLKEPAFPSGRIEAPSYDQLRLKVMEHVNNWLNAQWEKVIVVYMSGAVDQMSWDNATLIRDKNAVQFEFKVCFRSKDNLFWKEPDSTFVSRRIGDMVREGTADEKSCQCLPFSEDTLQALTSLREKFNVLAVALRDLVFRRTEDFVRGSKASEQPLLTV